MRTVGDPMRFADAIRNIVHTIDHDLPVSHVHTMEEALDQSLGRQQLNLLLLGIFAGFAALLAIVGLYGVIAYWWPSDSRNSVSGERSVASCLGWRSDTGSAGVGIAAVSEGVALFG